MAKTKKTTKATKPEKRTSTKSVRAARKVLNGMTREERTDTVAYLARSLIAKGYDNERVFAALEKRFGKKAMQGKRGYPSWYRADAVKRGLMSKRDAYRNA